MPKSKPDGGQVFIKEPEFTNTLEIHVTGDMMPNSVFFKILELLKKHMDNKTIVFAVYSYQMMRLIRESVPSEFYDKVQMFSPAAFERKEGLRRAG